MDIFKMDSECVQGKKLIQLEEYTTNEWTESKLLRKIMQFKRPDTHLVIYDNYEPFTPAEELRLEYKMQE